MSHKKGDLPNFLSRVPIKPTPCCLSRPPTPRKATEPPPQTDETLSSTKSSALRPWMSLISLSAPCFKSQITASAVRRSRIRRQTEPKRRRSEPWCLEVPCKQLLAIGLPLLKLESAKKSCSFERSTILGVLPNSSSAIPEWFGGVGYAGKVQEVAVGGTGVPRLRLSFGGWHPPLAETRHVPSPASLFRTICSRSAVSAEQKLKIQAEQSRTTHTEGKNLSTPPQHVLPPRFAFEHSTARRAARALGLSDSTAQWSGVKPSNVSYGN